MSVDGITKPGAQACRPQVNTELRSSADVMIKPEAKGCGPRVPGTLETQLLLSRSHLAPYLSRAPPSPGADAPELTLQKPTGQGMPSLTRIPEVSRRWPWEQLGMPEPPHPCWAWEVGPWGLYQQQRRYWGPGVEQRGGACLGHADCRAALAHMLNLGGEPGLAPGPQSLPGQPV